MKKFAVHRLSESARATVARHFLALPVQDRSLRFGMALGPAVIAAYVGQIDLDRDAVLGVHDERNALIGVAHVAIEDDQAEVALSVLPGHRRRGIGSALFRRAIAHARIRRMPRLFMRCLTANVPIMRLAQKFGMVIVESGSDADAFLDLQPASSTAVGAARNDATDANAVVRTPSSAPLIETHWSRILYYDLFSAESGECGSDPAVAAARDARLSTQSMHQKHGGILVAEKESRRNNAPQRNGFFTEAAAILLVVFVGLYLAVASASRVGAPDAELAPDRLDLSATVSASKPPAVESLDANSQPAQSLGECGSGPVSNASMSD
jgi:GNAT superfamily N-acetyltransferase